MSLLLLQREIVKQVVSYSCMGKPWKLIPSSLNSWLCAYFHRWLDGWNSVPLLAPAGPPTVVPRLRNWAACGGSSQCCQAQTMELIPQNKEWKHGIKGMGVWGGGGGGGGLCWAEGHGDWLRVYWRNHCKKYLSKQVFKFCNRTSLYSFSLFFLWSRLVQLIFKLLFACQVKLSYPIGKSWNEPNCLTSLAIYKIKLLIFWLLQWRMLVLRRPFPLGHFSYFYINRIVGILLVCQSHCQYDCTKP